MNNSFMNKSKTRICHPQVNFSMKVVSLDTDNPLVWLTQHLPGESSFVLAHAIDGVNWGRIENSNISFSHEVAPSIAPPPRVEMLQQLRVFNEMWEWFFWHDGQYWQQRIIDERTADISKPAIDEDHLVWGTLADSERAGYSVLSDGAQGLRHVVPLAAPNMFPTKRVVLQVRHYIDEQPNGVQFIALSRLVHLKVK